MACIALAGGDGRSAFDLLYLPAIQSRLQDPEILKRLHEAAKAASLEEGLDERLRAELHTRDAREQRQIESWGGRRVRFAGLDGTPVIGMAFPGQGGSRIGAIVFMTPTDSIADYDSLVVALTRHGISSILVPPRGSNWSVSATCPLPDSWVGREDALQRLVAGDGRGALRALACVARVDTSRYLVAGVGPSAPIAIQAARLDRRVRALLLVGPTPAPVERGPMRALLAALHLPVFFQIAPEEFNATYDVTDLFYQACDRGASRVAESNTGGRGAAQFRDDPTLAARFLEWLDGALKPAPSPRGPRPAGRRKG